MEAHHRIEIGVSTEEAERLRGAVRRLRAERTPRFAVDHMESDHHVSQRCRVRLWLRCSASVADPELEVRRLLGRPPVA